MEPGQNSLVCSNVAIENDHLIGPGVRGRRIHGPGRPRTFGLANVRASHLVSNANSSAYGKPVSDPCCCRGPSHTPFASTSSQNSSSPLT